MDGDLRQARQFQCSSASRKFLNPVTPRPRRRTLTVSVLFSEPKIPQFLGVVEVARADDCFSALQRAENSSIKRMIAQTPHPFGFSALQRAENSSIHPAALAVLQRECEFQCSSASRKFLNWVVRAAAGRT